MTERGRILRDTNAGPGLVTVSGKQFAFTLEGMWRSDVPPRVGMFVDVTLNDAGAPEALDAVPDTQLAKEQAHRAFSGALQHGKVLQGGMLKRFGLATAIAEALLVLAFFALPNLTVGPVAWTGWESTGLNPATMMTNDHGLLSLLCLLCLFAPVAVPFLKLPWARWLYLAPMVFCLVNLLAVFDGISRQTKAAASAIGGVFGESVVREVGNINQPSLAIGSYVVLLSAIYIATRSFRSSPTHELA